jgi:hypothetical protein
MSTFTKGRRNHSNMSHDDHNQGDAVIATRRARDATIHVQEDTKASLERTLAAATALGATTLDELYRQRQKLEQIQNASKNSKHSSNTLTESITVLIAINLPICPVPVRNWL